MVPVALLDGGSYDPDGDDISMWSSQRDYLELGTHYLTLTVSDGKGLEDNCTSVVTVVPNLLTDVSISAGYQYVADLERFSTGASVELNGSVGSSGLRTSWSTDCPGGVIEGDGIWENNLEVPKSVSPTICSVTLLVESSDYCQSMSDTASVSPLPIPLSISFYIMMLQAHIAAYLFVSGHPYQSGYST